MESRMIAYYYIDNAVLSAYMCIYLSLAPYIIILAMRFDIEVKLQSLRCLKGLFSTLIKVLYGSKQTANFTLIYFMKEGQIRFLASSAQCQTIVAIDSRMLTSDSTTKREGCQLLALDFVDGQKAIKSFLDLMDKPGMQDVKMTLSREKGGESQQQFRALNLVFKEGRYRTQVGKPLYDPENIIGHEWLNGCLQEDRKVQFDIETENLLNILRLFHRSKHMQQKNKYLRLEINFNARCLTTRFQTSLHMSQATISFCEFRLPKFEGIYTYLVKGQDVAKVYELFQGKSSGTRIYIDRNNHIVFLYFQEAAYESQLIIKNWMNFQSFQPRVRPPTIETKIQF